MHPHEILLTISTFAGNMAWQQHVVEPSVKVEVIKNHLNGENSCIESHQCRASCEYLDETFNI